MAGFFISTVLWGSVIQGSSGDPGATSGDLFDVSHGTTVFDSSPVIDGCSAGDIIGGALGNPTGGGCEVKGQVLFKDVNGNPWPFQPQPPFLKTSTDQANYFLTFTTPTPITLTHYIVYLQDDFNSGANRTVTELRMFLDDGAGNPTSLLSDVVILNAAQLNTGQVNYNLAYGHDDITVSDTFGAVTGSQFSAVFTNNPKATTGQGPRVLELDGFADAPEPSTLVLIGMGLLGLALTRKKA